MNANRIEFSPLALIAERDSTASRKSSKRDREKRFQVAGQIELNVEVRCWIEEQTPAVAILAATSDDSPTERLAEMLRRRGVLVLIQDEIAS